MRQAWFQKAPPCNSAQPVQRGNRHEGAQSPGEIPEAASRRLERGALLDSSMYTDTSASRDTGVFIPGTTWYGCRWELYWHWS